MAQPSKYFPAYSFTDFQTSSPATPLPASQVDAELVAIAVTTNELVDNIALIQRDDGALANNSVGPDQLTGEVLVALNVTAAWLTGTAYTVGYLVLQSGNVYRCLVAHTAGTFATDLSNGDWVLLLGAASSAMYDVIAAASHAAGRAALGSSTTGDALFITASSATARATLGSTTVGDAVFISSSAAVARTALGSTTVGDAVFIAANAAAARTALALGTISTQSAGAVAITGGAIDATIIGGSTPAAATVTALVATSASLSGDITMTAAAKGLKLKQGANGKCGTFVCNGTSAVTISNTSIAITDTIVISLNTVGGTVGAVPHVDTITASTGFTTKGTAADTSTYNYAIISNAA